MSDTERTGVNPQQKQAIVWEEHSASRPELGRKELANRLASFASEVEALVFLTISHSKTLLTPYSLHNQLVSSQASNPGWVVARSTVDQMVRGFEQEGLLHRNPEGNIELTASVAEDAVILAGLLLKFSSNATFSIRDLVSNSPELTERNLVVLGEAVKKNGYLSRVDINAMSIERTYEVMGKLNAAGVLTYQRSAGNRATNTRYFSIEETRVDEPTKKDTRYTKMAQSIIAIAREFYPQGRFISNDIIAHYIERNPQFTEAGVRAVGENVSRIMTDLTKAEFVKSLQSEGDVSLDPDQLMQVREFNRIVFGYENSDPHILREGSEFAATVMDSSELISKLMLKARAGSSIVSAGSAEDMTRVAISIARQAGEGGLLTQDLERSLHDLGFPRRERMRMTAFIRDLEKSGLIRREGIKIILVGVAADQWLEEHSLSQSAQVAKPPSAPTIDERRRIRHPRRAPSDRVSDTAQQEARPAPAGIAEAGLSQQFAQVTPEYLEILNQKLERFLRTTGRSLDRETVSSSKLIELGFTEMTGAFINVVYKFASVNDFIDKSRKRSPIRHFSDQDITNGQLLAYLKVMREVMTNVSSLNERNLSALIVWMRERYPLIYAQS